MCPPLLINFDDLIRDLDIEILTLYEFVQKIKEYNKSHDKNSFFTPFIKKFLDLSKEEFEKVGNIENNDLFVESFATINTLRKHGLDYPLIDSNLIELYFNTLEEEN